MPDQEPTKRPPATESSEVVTARAADQDAVSMPSARAASEDRFSPLVAEIRDRLASIAKRELALQQRERELDQGSDSAEVQRERQHVDQLDRLRSQLAARRSELIEAEAELNRRRELLDQRDAELAGREEQLERDREHVQRSVERLERQKQTDRAARRDERADLFKRSEQLKKMDRELRRRLDSAREEITEQRSALEQSREQLQHRAAELDARQARLDVLAAELQPFREQLQMRRAELDRWQATLKQDADQLARDRENLLEQQQRFERDWRDTRERGGDLARQTDDLQAQRRLIEQQQTELEKRLERLTGREQQFQKHMAELTSTQEELERRQAAVDQLYQEANERALQASSGLESAQELRNKLAAREAELRRIEMSLEVKQRELEQREALTVQRLEAQATMDAGAAPAAVPAAPEVVVEARPRWPRALVVSAAMGVAAAIGYALLFPPLWRVGLTLPVVTESQQVGPVLAEHASHLADPERTAAAVAQAGFGSAWASVAEQGGLRVHSRFSPPALTINLRTTDATNGEALLRAAVTPYIDAVNSKPAEPQLPPIYAGMATRRERVAEQVTQAARALATLEAQIAELPTAEDRAPVRAALEESRRAQETLRVALAERRDELERVRSEVPRGVVNPDELDELLAQDAVYQQDRAEYEQAAKTFQRQFGVTLLLLDEPAANLREAVRALDASVTEQRELQPPLAVAAVLETAATEVTRTSEPLDALLAQTAEWRTTLEKIDVTADIAPLVELHNTAVAQVRRVSEAADNAVTTLDAEVAKLGGDGGGTRAMVVAAVLRSDTRALESQASTFSETANAVTFEGNFELDAANRKVRGLLARLNRRQAQIEEYAQARADEKARAAHQQKLFVLREAVMELDSEREAALLNLIDLQEQLFDLDTQNQQRRALAVRLEYQRESLAALQAELAALDARLAEVRRGATMPDRFATADAQISKRIVANGGREWKAAVAGGSMAGLGLLASLVLLGPPRRSAPKETARANERTADAAEVPSSNA